jgi:hypothetical protein
LSNFVQRDVELAVREAIGLARMRGGKLASLTLEGPLDVLSTAVSALLRYGAGVVEVHRLPGTAVRLVSVEIVPAPNGSS